MVKLRAEMKKKVWETNRGLSWYVDKSSGLCTVSSLSSRSVKRGEEGDGIRTDGLDSQTLYPWNQVTFYRNTRAPREVDFFRR